MAIWSLVGDQRISDGGALTPESKTCKTWEPGGVPRLPTLDVGTLGGGDVDCRAVPVFL